jgi:hypothetical protein
MGVVNSLSSSAETVFRQALEEFITDPSVDATPVFCAAGNLETLECISIQDLKSLCVKYYEPMRTFITQASAKISLTTDQQVLHGCLAILARVLPLMLVTRNTTSSFDWLVSGEESLFDRLFLTLRSIVFAPGIFNPIDNPTPRYWTWEVYPMPPHIISSRIDLLNLFFLVLFSSFFFLQNGQMCDGIRRLSFLGPSGSNQMIKSISDGLKKRLIPFSEAALPYAQMAAIYDSEFRSSIKDSELMEVTVNLLYTKIEEVNAIIAPTFTIDAFEVDLEIFSYIALLGGPGNYDALKLCICMLRLLQIANETKTININHRVTLTILSIITSSKKNAALLRAPLTMKTGTKYQFNQASVGLALFECVTTTFELQNSAGLHRLILSLVHNIAADVIGNEWTSNQCFAKLLALVVKKESLLDLLLVAMQRYVHGAGASRDELKRTFRHWLEGYDKYEEKRKIEAAIDVEEYEIGLQLVIGDTEGSFRWINEVILQLYAKRNYKMLNGCPGYVFS